MVKASHCPVFVTDNEVGNNDYNMINGKAAKQGDWLVLEKPLKKYPESQLVLYSLIDQREIPLNMDSLYVGQVSNISISGRQIYYKKLINGAQDSVLASYNLNTHEETVISTSAGPYMVYSNQIFSIEQLSNEVDALMVYDAATLETKAISSGQFRYINVVDDTVFYFDTAKSMLMSYDIDTEETTDIYQYSEGYIDNVIRVNESEIWFKCNGDDHVSTILKMNLVSGELNQVFSGELCLSFAIKDDTLYLNLAAGIASLDPISLEKKTILSFGDPDVSWGNVAFFDTCIVVHFDEIVDSYLKTTILIHDYDGNVLHTIP